MTSSISDIPKKRGRPSTGGRKPGLMVRLDDVELAALDRVIAEAASGVSAEKISRPEALRRAAREGLTRMGLLKP